MTTCIIRTCIIYIILVLVMRLTGKRQIGELEISELVSTVLISEIAAAPVGNQDIPITFAILPILLIVSLEVIISHLATRFNFMKKIFIGTPSILIKGGKLQLSELTKARMSLEELLCELRVCGTSTIEDVDYAILESNGKLSVVQRASAKNATAADVGASPSESGIAHAVIIDGTVKKEALEGSGKNISWLNSQIKKANLSLEEIFLFTVDDANHTYIIRRKDTE